MLLPRSRLISSRALAGPSTLTFTCRQVASATRASRLAEYDPGVTRPLLEACVAVCQSCGDECDRHAPHHAHCRVCAEACRRCEQACRELLEALK